MKKALHAAAAVFILLPKVNAPCLVAFSQQACPGQGMSATTLFVRTQFPLPRGTRGDIQ